MVCTWQLGAPGWQVTNPEEVRGWPPFTAPSQAAALVRAAPWQFRERQSTEAEAREAEDGPAVGWPGSGLPSLPSLMKSKAEEASELVWPRQPPLRTEQAAVSEEPRRNLDTAVSSAEVSA
ncbi:hypothetical protein GCM10023321_70260 [Pseudonocardia eucalypti]|uniref:Uncharacterized protein n=1 Tax=Pseudonocardia eucalypti TaxID=648755 RepID=A0ABP9R4S9_9PSEU